MKMLWICALFGVLTLVIYSRAGHEPGNAIEASAGGRAPLSAVDVPFARSLDAAPGVATDAALTPAQYVLLHQSRDENWPAGKPNAGESLRN